MADATHAAETTLRAYFGNRASAEAACARLRAADARFEPRLGVAGEDGDYVVTVSTPHPEGLHAARTIADAAGAERIEEGEAAMAPRPVQPGFTDAPPGIVPEAAEFPDEKYEGAGGRFANQLDDAPETPDPSDKR